MSSPPKSTIKPKHPTSSFIRKSQSPNPFTNNTNSNYNKLPNVKLTTTMKPITHSINHSPITKHNKFITRKDYAERLSKENSRKLIHKLQLQKAPDIERITTEDNTPMPTPTPMSMPIIDKTEFDIAKELWIKKEEELCDTSTIIKGGYIVNEWNDALLKVNKRMFKGVIEMLNKKNEGCDGSAMKLDKKKGLLCDYKRRVEEHKNRMKINQKVLKQDLDDDDDDIEFNEKDEENTEAIIINNHKEKDKIITEAAEIHSEKEMKIINEEHQISLISNSLSSSISNNQPSSTKLNSYHQQQLIQAQQPIVILSSTSSSNNILSIEQSSYNFQVLSTAIPTCNSNANLNQSISSNDSIADITINSFNTNSIIDKDSSFDDLYNSN